MSGTCTVHGPIRRVRHDRSCSVRFPGRGAMRAGVPNALCRMSMEESLRMSEMIPILPDSCRRSNSNENVPGASQQ